MNKLKQFFKKFGYDIAGYTCLALVLPIGILPGPGGVPLLIAGLGLLSVHNKWAKSLLDNVRKHSVNMRTVFFPNKPVVQKLWDILAITILVCAITIQIRLHPGYVINSLSIAASAAAISILFFNRGRIESIQRYFKTKR